MSTSMHSESNDFLCPKCEDRGFVFIDNNTVRFCECREQRKVERLMRTSHITDEFKKLNFKNFLVEGKPGIIQDAYKCAVNYCKAFPDIKDSRQNSISLLGQPGAGKTHLLIAAANYFLKHGIGVLYFPYREGFDEIKDDLETSEEKFDRMKSVDILFIDDLFKGGATNYEIKQMYAVVNHRYLNHKPIMISSEFREDDLLDVDEALGSRILEMSGAFLVSIQKDRALNHRIPSAR